jgi:hypothetical protein
MRIEKLGPDSCEAYIAFRKAMWPLHDSAGHWDVVVEKYFRNTHVELCPGAGLYACTENGTIRGIAGAYPMPITLEGRLYPGHMLVDWAVLPDERESDDDGTWERKVYAAKLFASVMELPGLKFGSNGTRFSQAALQRRSTRIPTCNVAALIKPAHALLLELFRLRQYSQPSPACMVPMHLPAKARSVSPDDLPNSPPANLQGTAHVWRDVTFWQQYFKCRLYNGAYALQLGRDHEVGYVVLNLLEAGRFRFANLLTLYLANASPRTAHRLGVFARKALQELGVCSLLATDADETVHAFLNGVGRYVVRRPTHWWRIPHPSDLLPVQGVRWHFTSAERDGIWWPGQQTPQPAQQKVRARHDAVLSGNSLAAVKR